MADNHIEQAYIHADKAIGHYQRLLAGDGLTARDQRMFRLLLIRAVWARCEALRLMEAEIELEAV